MSTHAVVVVLLALTLSVPLHATATPPPVGDEIVLDHGWRYAYDVEYAAGVAVAVADSAVLFGWSDSHVTTAILKAPGGGGIAGDLTRSLGDDGRFDFGAPDSLGWRMACTESGPWGATSRALRVRILERETLAILSEGEIDPPGGPSIQNPEIERGAGFHLVAWTEGSPSACEIRLQRVAPDLTPIDPAPIVVASGLPGPTIDLVLDEAGGLIAYVDSQRRVIAQRLGPDGLPIGGGTILGPASSWYQVAAASCGPGWLVAWTSPAGDRAAFVDSDGAIVTPPGVFSLPEYTASGLGAAGRGDGLGLVAWRTGDILYGETRAVRVAWGTGVVGSAYTVHADSPYEQGHDESRTLACAWTGASFESSGRRTTRRPSAGMAPGASSSSYGKTPVDTRSSPSMSIPTATRSSPRRRS